MDIYTLVTLCAIANCGGGERKTPVFSHVMSKCSDSRHAWKCVLGWITSCIKGPYIKDVRTEGEGGLVQKQT